VNSDRMPGFALTVVGWMPSRSASRIVTAEGWSVPLDELYPPVEPPRAIAA